MLTAHSTLFPRPTWPAAFSVILLLLGSTPACWGQVVFEEKSQVNRSFASELGGLEGEERSAVWLSLPPHNESLLGAVVIAKDNRLVVIDRLPAGTFESGIRWQSSEPIVDNLTLQPSSNLIDRFITGLKPLSRQYEVELKAIGVEMRSMMPKREDTIRRFLLASRPTVAETKKESSLYFVTSAYRGSLKLQVSFHEHVTAYADSALDGFSLSRPNPNWEQLELVSDEPAEFAYRLEQVKYVLANSGEPMDAKLVAAAPDKQNLSKWETEPRLMMAGPENFYRVQVFYASDRNFGEPLPAEVKRTFWMEFASFFMTAECWMLVAIAFGVAVLATALLFWLIKAAVRPLRVVASIGACIIVALLVAGWWAKGLAEEKIAQAGAIHHDKATAIRGPLTYGTCEVSIPKNHHTGVLERPVQHFLIDLEPENPSKHIALLDRTPLEKKPFFDALDVRLAESPEHECFVFVHGYNNSFKDAATRTAQLWYDLQFPGAPIFFSWPSQGNRAGYTFDESNAGWAQKHFEDFIIELQSRPGIKRIHLIAHSMGNRILAGALQNLAANGTLKVTECKFREIVLTAPDIDADTFKDQIAPKFTKQQPRVTLYASANDGALKFSLDIHQYNRAGDASNGIVIVGGMDSIDASKLDTSLDTHGYFAAHRTVIEDFHYLIVKGLPPSERHGLQEVQVQMDKYWEFRP